jgi:hypothetical protein
MLLFHDLPQDIEFPPDFDVSQFQNSVQIQSMFPARVLQKNTVQIELRIPNRSKKFVDTNLLLDLLNHFEDWKLLNPSARARFPAFAPEHKRRMFYT